MENKNVPITYRKSFLAKYILSDDRVKKVYTIIKNKLMSIDNMKSRISWFYDAFNVGRINFAKISVRGKYVALYLNLDTKDYPENIYHQEDVSDRRRFKETSFKIHVKSDRTIKYAMRLIDDEIKKFNLKTNPIPKENYYLDYENPTPLIKRKLISVVEEKYVYAPKEQIEVDNFQTPNDDKIFDENKNTQVIFVDGSKVFVKERKSFEAKLIQSPKELQNYYSILKNELLTFIKVKSRISWKYEAFSLGRVKLAKFQIRGKYLVVFFSLDPKKYQKVKGIENATKYELFKDTPVMLRVKNDEKLELAKSLIEDLKKRFLLEEGFIKENHNFEYDYLGNEKLIKQGLIRIYAKFGDYSNKYEESIGEEIFSKKKNIFPVYREEKRFVLSIDENNNFVEREEIIKIPLEGERDVVYLDTIDENYKWGETIDINSLKEKNLLSPEIDFYKLVYRGGDFNKAVSIICQASSPFATKMVEDAGGSVTIKVE